MTSNPWHHLGEERILDLAASLALYLSIELLKLGLGRGERRAAMASPAEWP